jgi:hypothetical protein
VSLQRWMVRALRAELWGRRQQRRAELAERVAAAAMKRLSDDELLEIRHEIGGETHDQPERDSG